MTITTTWNRFLGRATRGTGFLNLDDSLREVIDRLKHGDERAAQVIWDRYFPQVVQLAGQRLAGQQRRAVDEEDVAISVMESFFRAARDGRFPDLKDRDGVWRLLSTMTRRKVIDYVRRNAARPAVGESGSPGDVNAANALDFLVGPDPSPALAAALADQVEHLMSVLPEKYHAIALKKLECLTLPEIARECGVHVSTVERRLRIIREFWARELDGQEDES